MKTTLFPILLVSCFFFTPKEFCKYKPENNVCVVCKYCCILKMNRVDLGQCLQNAHGKLVKGKKHTKLFWTCCACSSPLCLLCVIDF